MEGVPTREPLSRQAKQHWLQFAGRRGLLEPVADSTLPARQLCYTVLLHEGLSTLGQIDESIQSGWQERLGSYQDPVSGQFLFAHGAARTGELPAVPHKDVLLDTFLALHALDALDASAPHPLRFVERFNARRDLGDWTAAQNTASSQILLPFFLIYRAEVEGNKAAFELFHHALDWLEQTQEPVSGLWGPGATRWSITSLVIAGQILPYFEYVYRPISRVTRMLDSVLEHRQADGSIIGVAGDNARADLALVDLLATLSRKTSYRIDEVQDALRHSYESISRKASGEGEESALTDVSPSLAAEWCHAYLTALGTIEAAYEGPMEAGESWQARRWPGPGYHRPFEALSDREKMALRSWQRPLRPVQRQENQGTSSPRISVIIPCYNLGLYLYEAIDTVLQQTLRDIEIIVVDDGSEDSFTQFLLSALEYPLLTIIHQQNQGVAAARNFGIRHARSEYISCLDPDDRLHPTFFEKAVGILDEQSAVGLVTGHLEFFDERGGILAYEDCDFPELLVANRVVEPAVFRREGWERAGGYRSFSQNGIEDWDLWITLVEQGYRVAMIPEVVWYYRIRANQMSEEMFRPATWGLLARELVLAHQPTYSRYMPEVIAAHSARWSELRQWTLEQERAIAWWTRQSASWEQIARERESYIEELRAWIAELEKDKRRLESQRESTAAVAPERVSRPTEGRWLRLQQYLRGRNSERHD